MKIDKQSRGEFIMSKKVQLNDMELNQVAGGGFKEFWQKLKDAFRVEPRVTTRPIPVMPPLRY